jgi:hypothetical protein
MRNIASAFAQHDAVEPRIAVLHASTHFDVGNDERDLGAHASVAQTDDHVHQARRHAIPAKNALARDRDAIVEPLPRRRVPGRHAA